ncbi:MAG: recombinase family protein [Oscillospiraceae bacterium]|jgi:DNA invertase Pin-like site-specific DNA recombinase|nr:recombinase family protein [Oscillospiraceae bacterium]
MPRIRKTIPSGAAEWRVALYIRLSKEDGKDESLSVTNQRKILTDFLQENWGGGAYTLADTYIDDGLTGTDTHRENFLRMKQDIADGKVNCVIVKSLARAFRNLADQQKFLEEFLPLHQTRFISLGSPRIDTWENPGAVSGFEVPIRGMFNEQFAAATSEEIRKTFHMKRSRGEFIGAFAPYGYRKHPENKNKLLVDDEAALVVKDVFQLFLYDGLSINGIAKKLNGQGVCSPVEYKKQQGLNYQNPGSRFQLHPWNPTTVTSILKNRMYTGCMVQGRQRVISYKIHKQVKTPESEWYVIEGTHEAVIGDDMFEAVQRRLLRDTRTAPGQTQVHLFAGFLKCADCGRALHRKTARGHAYYYCRIGRQTAGQPAPCPPKSIREDALHQAVLQALQMQISQLAGVQQVIDRVNSAPAQKSANRPEQAIQKHRQECDRLTRISDALYADWKAEILTKEEFVRMKADYTQKLAQIRHTIAVLEEEQQAFAQGKPCANVCFAQFQQHRTITALNRAVLVDLIDGITLRQGNALDVQFKFAKPDGCA